MGFGSKIKSRTFDGDDGVEDGGGGDSGDGGGSVSCSICLETVTDNGDRSWAKLQCGHQFHLDCIGSAFNAKGMMQCPNCRKIEKGQWLYANGCRSIPEFNMEDFVHDEDLYDLSYSEMSFGVHWCPFGSLTRLPSSFEDGEFSSSSYHDFLGQHGFFAEHTAASSAAHPCPYFAYIGPIQPSSSTSSTGVSDSSNFNNHWSGPPVPREMPTPYFPPMDPHYHTWEYHTSPFSTSSNHVGNANPAPPVAPRSVRTSSDVPRPASFPHPFPGHSSGARASSSIASSRIPPYPGSNARTRDRVQALQAYYQLQHPSDSQAAHAPIISGTRRSNRGTNQMGSAASSSDQSNGFTRLNAWERDHHLSFSLNQVDHWTFHQAADGSDSGHRSGSFRQRHGSQNRS